MKIEGHTILITGGGTGIGLAIAEAFLEKGNTVFICGRRESKLIEARKKYPKLHFKDCDLSKKNERELIFSWVSTLLPNINMLVNNAGIQRKIDFRNGTHDLLQGEDEIETNLKAAIHLSSLFVPHFIKKESDIINVTSGLAFVPMASAPVYCATKAALHSFSISLRHQFRETPIKVFELIPPMVDTALDKGTRKERGIQPKLVADVLIEGMENNLFEIAVGMAEQLRANAGNPDSFKRMN